MSSITIFLLLWCVVSLPVWTAYAASLPVTSGVVAAVVGAVLTLVLPLWASKAWGGCASFDKTMAPSRWRHWFIAAALTAVICCSDFVVVYAASETGQLLPPKRYSPRNPCLVIAYLALIFLLAPAAEEIFWRGYALEQFRKVCNPWLAVPLHAAFFGVQHIPAQGMYGFIGAFNFGVAFGYFRVRYRALSPIIVCHAALNIFHTLLPFALESFAS